MKSFVYNVHNIHKHVCKDFLFLIIRLLTVSTISDVIFPLTLTSQDLFQFVYSVLQAELLVTVGNNKKHVRHTSRPLYYRHVICLLKVYVKYPSILYKLSFTF